MRKRAMVNSVVRASAAMLVGWGSATICLATDVVVLRSGTMMEGEVVRLSGDELVMQIESGRSILDRSDIRSIHLDTTVAALTGKGGDDDEKKAEPDDGDDEGDFPVFGPRDKEEFEVGDAIKSGSLRLRLTSAAPARVEIIDLLGNRRTSNEEHYVVSFRVENTSGRGELRIMGDPAFGEARIRMEDQDGTEIEKVGFGVGNRVEGSLASGTRIGPGDSANHIEVFERPTDSVESVVVSVDLARFGGAGVVRYRMERDEE